MNESLAFTGGCACGALRYATTQAPVFQNHCQCRDCQRRSGTGHGSWLTFGDRALPWDRIDDPVLKAFERMPGS